MKLKPSEIRFWQEAILVAIGAEGINTTGLAAEWADNAVFELRARIEEPGPRPDEGRL